MAAGQNCCVRPGRYLAKVDARDSGVSDSPAGENAHACGRGPPPSGRPGFARRTSEERWPFQVCEEKKPTVVLAPCGHVLREKQAKQKNFQCPFCPPSGISVTEGLAFRV